MRKLLIKTAGSLTLSPAADTRLFRQIYRKTPFYSRVAGRLSPIKPTGPYFNIKLGGDTVGQVGFEADYERPNKMLWLQYGVREKYRKKGYGQRAVRLALARLRQQGDTRQVWATVDEENTPSIRLLRSVGFQAAPKSDDEELQEAGLLHSKEWRYRYLDFPKDAQFQAAGIPSRSEYGELKELKPLVGELTPWVVSKHEAERAGTHYDIRIQGPEGLYSWAAPKGLPQTPGLSSLAIRQPIHEPRQLSFQGEIGEGYGKGRVTLDRTGSVLLDELSYDDQGAVKGLKFSYGSGRGTPERYLLTHGKGKNWYLVNVTPDVTPQELGYEKPHYKTIDRDKLEELLEQVSEELPISAKLDGGLNLLRFLKDHAEVLSYRTTTKGEPIYHTERIAPELLAKRDIPKELWNRVFSGEVYGVSDGAIPINELGAILNSALARARERIRKANINIRMALIEVVPGNENIDEKRRQELIRTAIETLPQFLSEPPTATNPQEAKKLTKLILTGHHPLTREGLVLTLSDGRKVKFKPVHEHDVIVTRVLPGKGRLEGMGAGAIEYTLVPGGPPVGNVGTGKQLTDALRREIWENRDDLVGSVIKLESQGQFPSGAFRSPSLLSIYTDYPTTQSGKKYWGPEIASRITSGN